MQMCAMGMVSAMVRRSVTASMATGLRSATAASRCAEETTCRAVVDSCRRLSKNGLTHAASDTALLHLADVLGEVGYEVGVGVGRQHSEVLGGGDGRCVCVCVCV